MTPSYVASLRRVMDAILRGEERAHRNGTLDSPLGSGPMFYPFNVRRRDRDRERDKGRERQARKTKESPKTLH